MKYFFVLGQSPKLSLTEINSVLVKQKLDFKIIDFSDQVLLIQTKEKIDTEETQDILGGTIKIGKIIGNCPINELTPEFILSVFQPETETKFHFGFSTYYLDQTKFKLPKNFGLEVKGLLKEKGIASRLVVSRETNLSSVTVAKNRLLKNGAEICLLVAADEIYLGQTLTVQKFGEYSKFDYDRPGRDSHSGMLPPKVSKMMINLAQTSGDTILDPFCGSGTILMQTAILGYRNLIGSDISDKAISDTRKNIDYLKTNASDLDFEIALDVLDVSKLSDKLKLKSVDAIIAEPFMGPPLRGNESAEQIKNIISELSNLYLKAFTEFQKVLKPNGKVVIIFPVLKNTYSMKNENLEKIKQLGFDLAWNLPTEFQDLLSERNSIIYSRPGQSVEREIFVFAKSKS